MPKKMTQPQDNGHLSSQVLQVTRPTPAPPAAPGPLHGVRAIELAHEFTAFAGKLLADAGADVILIEPPDGAEQRSHGPFADGAPEALESSLSFWAENTSKRSVVLDLTTDDGRADLARLLDRADVLLEAEAPNTVSGLDVLPDAESNPGLIHAAITPFGQADVGAAPGSSTAAVTDLTLLARGGPMWSCGYDDHDLPPVRGRGNQGLRMASHFAVMSILTALVARNRSGHGQFLDVSMTAAANVTTEFASYSWLAAQQTVQRQTGRHATPQPSEPTQVRCADGRYLNTGVPPRSSAEFTALLGWIIELGLGEDFALTPLLEMGTDIGFITLQMIAEDPLVGEIFGAGREAMGFIASNVSAHDAFLGFQTRGIAAGVVWSPDEVMTDPHFIERGFPTPVHHDQIDEEVNYPGPPIRFEASPMQIRGPAPHLGQHTDEVLADLNDATGEPETEAGDA